MAFAYARLKEIAQLTDSAAAVYTNPSATTTYIRQILLHNPHTATVIVELWAVPDSGGSAGTAADANKIYSEALAAGATRMIEFAPPGFILLDENETIQGKGSVASKVTISIMGATE